MRLASESVQMLESLMFQTSVAQKATAHAKAGSAARKMVFGFINGLNSAPGFSCRSLSFTEFVGHLQSNAFAREAHGPASPAGIHINWVSI